MTAGFWALERLIHLRDMKRTVTPELLDSDAGTPEEVLASLEDLRWLNRYFGGLSTTTKLLARVAERTGARKLSYLDVASATGDGAMAAQEYLAKRDIQLETTLLDRAVSHLSSPHSPGNGARSVPLTAAALSGDALHLPFADGSFDAVGSSLFTHHLEPVEVVRFLAEALRVARVAVIINDLRRGWLHLLAAHAGGPIYRSRITRADAPASVRRAYTQKEMLAMVRQTGAADIEVSSHYFYRIGLVVWKNR